MGLFAKLGVYRERGGVAKMGVGNSRRLGEEPGRRNEGVRGRRALSGGKLGRGRGIGS